MKKKLNSKTKGNRVEREIAKLFEERFNKDFKRVPGSGSFFSANPIKLTENLSGDIMTPENFRYSIEIKARKDMSFFNILFPPNKELDNFITQVEKDANLTGKKPLLIIKINNRPPFCLIKNMPSKIKYKDYSIILLSELFKKKDDFFFESQVNI